MMTNMKGVHKALPVLVLTRDVHNVTIVQDITESYIDSRLPSCFECTLPPPRSRRVERLLLDMNPSSIWCQHLRKPARSGSTTVALNLTWPGSTKARVAVRARPRAPRYLTTTSPRPGLGRQSAEVDEGGRRRRRDQVEGAGGAKAGAAKELEKAKHRAKAPTQPNPTAAARPHFLLPRRVRKLARAGPRAVSPARRRGSRLTPAH